METTHRTIVVRTTYEKSISFHATQVEDIKRADVLEIRDKDTGELLAHADPKRVLKSAARVWCHDEETGNKWPSSYLVSPFVPGDDYSPSPKKLRTILRKRAA